MDFTTAISGNILYIYPTTDIINNRQYSVILNAGISGTIPTGDIAVLEDIYQFWFTSIYCPQFSTINRIKLQVGPLAANIIDDTIWRMIHKNSIDAVDLYNMSNNTNYAYDFWGCDWQDVPSQLKRYVECKTAYDLLSIMRVTQQMSGDSANQLKTLGDMTIKYGGGASGPSSAVDPKRLADLYACWNESMRMFRNMQVTVKAYYDVSKGYGHPVRQIYDNRVIRPVSPFQGNYTPGTPYWRGI
jgi:hypothetical protein